MTASLDYADMTLDELRLALAPEIAASAVFDGWNETALVAAAEMAGADVDVAKLAFPTGPAQAMDMIDAWIAHVDAAMEEEWPAERLAELKIRERIRTLVAFRLEAVEHIDEAVRRAMSVMAMPQNAPRAMKLGWRSADIMWRLAGDTATDYNHYTKRAILAGIYSATLAVFVNDDSEGKAKTHEFLDRRIDGVMKFEKVKAQFLDGDRELPSLTRFLGRLRYPSR
ncbi:COQ9 family protein [Erythrobacter sp. SCSIO 43205]|uniref:COQ9 family protein n=1 Tax=Erythrobacter sp. SCSIO 43205 TaxID=2779361 RepID=UPI001CA8BBC4|nr:COQ9 family protein [Erythrobacter sp. SCSIO 43205]UAB78881.1 COQ9 family protein [Erythrobacter sp. SCSIO 43205]